MPVPTPMIFMLRPRSGHAQWISAETYLVSPITRITEFTDAFGNLCQRLVAPVGDLTVRTSVDVLLPHRPAEGPAEATFVEIPDLPDPVLVYLLPSRFCESDRFGDHPVFSAWPICRLPISRTYISVHYLGGGGKK